jgi:hypothetical protein
VTPDRLLGRVVASSRLIGMAGVPIGGGLGGLVASGVGLRAAYSLTGLLGLVATGLIVVATAGLADEPATQRG